MTFDTRIRVRQLIERMDQLDNNQQAIVINRFNEAIEATSNSLPENLKTYEDKYLMYAIRWMKGVVG